MIMVQRPEYVEYIQKTNFENYPKGEALRSRFADLLSENGIFVADGDVWRSQRKMASHMFSARQFNNWVKSVVHRELDTIDGLLENIASNADTTNNNTIAMPQLFFRYTLSSFTKMAFSADLDCLSTDPASLEKPVPFAVAFDYAQGVINTRFVTPLWNYVEMFSNTGREMRKSIKVITDFGSSIIKKRLAESEEKPSTSESSLSETDAQTKNGKDLLGFFMEHTKDPNDLLTIVLNFVSLPCAVRTLGSPLLILSHCIFPSPSQIIAGRDTTAQALSWIFYELAAHPEHVELIREEVDQVMGSNASLEKNWLKVEDMKRLPYTLAVMHETIRLHPPVPKNGKQVLKDDVIIPQGPNPHNLPPLQVYAGELVGWSDWVMNRLEDVWGPDAAEFNPQRFLHKGEKGEWVYVNQSPWKFHVFNA
jgi:cytochrome P450